MGVFTGNVKNPVLIAVRRRTNTAVPYLVNVLFTGAVLTNFMACLLFFVASVEGLNDSWIAKGGPVCEDGVEEDCGGYVADSARTRQYLASVYWAITTVSCICLILRAGTCPCATSIHCLALIIAMTFFSSNTTLYMIHKQFKKTVICIWSSATLCSERLKHCTVVMDALVGSCSKWMMGSDFQNIICSTIPCFR